MKGLGSKPLDVLQARAVCTDDTAEAPVLKVKEVGRTLGKGREANGCRGKEQEQEGGRGGPSPAQIVPHAS